MTVYAIVQVEIFDREAYDRYSAKFWNVFKQFNGSMLVNDESPKVLEGDWSHNKVVLFSFADEAAFHAWADSPQYNEIVVDRRAGANVTILLSEQFSLHS
ncbi:MAG: hypothetical protein ACJA2E_002557 [Arenicella sp.]|jgi:uncharacterized protein (DUF1330 family)